MYTIPAFLNDLNPANLSNLSSLQINSQPVAEGAGGRGEALEYESVSHIARISLHELLVFLLKMCRPTNACSHIYIYM